MGGGGGNPKIHKIIILQISPDPLQVSASGGLLPPPRSNYAPSCHPPQPLTPTRLLPLLDSYNNPPTFMTVLCLMENVVCNVQVELSANMKLLNAKNSELQSFIQRLNGNCSIIQVKILNIVLIDFRHHTQGFKKPGFQRALGTSTSSQILLVLGKS